MKQKMVRILSLLAFCCVLSSSGFGIISGPSTITYVDAAGHQRIYSFAIADSGHLVLNYWDGFSWQWADHGKPVDPLSNSVDPPTAITYKDAAGNQRIYVFMNGDNGHLVVNYWDGFSWQWADQGKYLPMPHAITYSQRNQRIYVFGGDAVTGGMAFNYSYSNGVTWNWGTLGEPSAFSAFTWPAPVTYVDASGKRRIYVFGNAGNLVLHYSDGISWHWADLGLPFGVAYISGPCAISYKNAAGNQEIYAFASASDGHLYMKGWNGSPRSTWHWVDRGLPAGMTSVFPITDSPITFLDSAGHQRIYVFAQGSNGHLVVNYWDGVSWHWADHGTL